MDLKIVIIETSYKKNNYHIIQKRNTKKPHVSKSSDIFVTERKSQSISGIAKFRFSRNLSSNIEKWPKL